MFWLCYNLCYREPKYDKRDKEKDETKVSVSENNYDDYKAFRKDFLDMWHKVMKLKAFESVITVFDVFEANDTAYAIDLTKYACEIGCDAMLVVTPYYNKATQNGLIKSFTVSSLLL